MKKLMNHRDTLPKYQQMIDTAPVPQKDHLAKTTEERA
jgi:hypothetical protein